MKRLLPLILALVILLPSCKQEEKVQLAKPSEKQLKFADWEIGAFIHYGLNVYTGQEHGDGQEPASKFNPTELDAEQWVLAAKKLGAKYACLTARHEGGFCLWPTETTEYSIKNSPYKDGKGDIVKEFVDACRKHGIVPALYHTATFDSNARLGGDYASWGSQELPLKWNSKASAIANREADARFPNQKERLEKIQLAQMRELLTNYGPIGFMWSDHWDAKDPDGLWRKITDLVAELQPDMVFMGPETWVPGNETGHVVYPMWNAVYTVDSTNYSRPKETKPEENTSNDYGLLETQALTGHPLGQFWRVRECTTSWAFRNGPWFWHNDTKIPSLGRHLDLYYRTVGLGANTIINLPPNDKGLVPDQLVEAAERFGNEIKKRFSNPVAKLGKVVKDDEVVLKWKTPTEINTVMIMENIKNGQKVAKYTLEAYVDGEWVELKPMNKHYARAPYNPTPGFETIGHKKIDCVTPVVTNKIRFKCTQAVAPSVEIRELAVFNCEPYWNM